jgi:hypothetical protein
VWHIERVNSHPARGAGPRFARRSARVVEHGKTDHARRLTPIVIHRLKRASSHPEVHRSAQEC